MLKIVSSESASISRIIWASPGSSSISRTFTGVASLVSSDMNRSPITVAKPPYRRAVLSHLAENSLIETYSSGKGSMDFAYKPGMSDFAPHSSSRPLG